MVAQALQAWLVTEGRAHLIQYILRFTKQSTQTVGARQLGQQLQVVGEVCERRLRIQYLAKLQLCSGRVRIVPEGIKVR